MTAAPELEHGPVDRSPAAGLRVELQVASVASGLLLLLDAHRLTGRLPLEIQVQVGRLRHAVKVAIQAQAGRPFRRRARQAWTRLRRCGPGSPLSPGPSPAPRAGCTCWWECQREVAPPCLSEVAPPVV